MTVRDPHFTDVVQERAAGDMPQKAFFDSHGSRNRDRKRRHALAVAFGFRVLCVQGAAQGLQRVIVGLFQVLQRDRKLLRALGDQLLQVALIRAILQHQVSMFQRAPHAQVELIFLEWLQNVVVRAGADGFERDRNVVHRRDHDHRDVRIVQAQLAQKLQAVHLRHHDVAQDQVERVFAESFEAQLAVRAGRALKALRVQKRRDNLAYRLFVVYNEDFFLRHGRSVR